MTSVYTTEYHTWKNNIIFISVIPRLAYFWWAAAFARALEIKIRGRKGGDALFCRAGGRYVSLVVWNLFNLFNAIKCNINRDCFHRRPVKILTGHHSAPLKVSQNLGFRAQFLLLFKLTGECQATPPLDGLPMIFVLFVLLPEFVLFAPKYRSRVSTYSFYICDKITN